MDHIYYDIVTEYDILQRSEADERYDTTQRLRDMMQHLVLGGQIHFPVSSFDVDMPKLLKPDRILPWARAKKAGGNGVRSEDVRGFDISDAHTMFQDEVGV